MVFIYLALFKLVYLVTFMDFFILFWQNNGATAILGSLVILSSIVGFFSQAYFQRLVLVPYAIFRKERLYTLVTASFVHKNVIHLVLNVLVLSIIGPGFEQDLKVAHLSPFYLLFFFVLCSLAGHLGSAWYHKSNMRIRSMGASGGALGLMAMHLVLNPFRYMLNLQGLGQYSGLAVLGFLFLVTAIGLGRQSDEMVDHWNHFYGVLGGTVIALFFFWSNTAGIFNYYF